MSDYLDIKKHYETCFKIHGDNHKGVDWPDINDLEKRYKIMLDVSGSDSASLLDVGCGTAMFYEYLKQVRAENRIKYVGLDISETFVSHCKQKYPELNFICLDLLQKGAAIPSFDYAILNGVFTEKLSLTEEAMWGFFSAMLKKVFGFVDKGIAFNLMSKNVDWEREDLFHVSLDKVSAFICKNLSRNFVIRNDYGLYEYTIYVYR